MADTPLIARSIAEVNLYLRATPCASCQEGPLQGADPDAIEESAGKVSIAIRVTCGSCGARSTLTFQLPDRPEVDRVGQPAEVDPTDEPSHIIDVAQWITLAYVIVEEAKKETDSVRARQRNLEAARCIDEALKFYSEPDNDLPPPEAFFLDASRRGFREHPEEFSRQRLINLRSRLPTASAGEAPVRSANPKPKGRWWRKRQ